MGQIVNIDALKFDVPSNRTVDKKEETSVIVKMNGQEKHTTLVLLVYCPNYFFIYTNFRSQK